MLSAPFFSLYLPITSDFTKMITPRLKKLQYYYIYFTAFPAILLVQNLSAFFFPVLVYDYHKRFGNKFLAGKSVFDILAGFIGIGAIVSVAGASSSGIDGGIANSIAVLPNYLYWVVALLFFSGYGKELDFQAIFKGVFWGIITSTIYFYTINEYIGGIPVLKYLQQNIYSFLLIAFSPMFVYYTEQKYGRVWAHVAAVGVVMAGALSGSRSGSLLTILTCFLTLYSMRIHLPRFVGFVLLILVFPIVIQIEAVKNLIFDLNERTYELIYFTEDVLKKDESYLIRVAQVEKGLAIFEERPITGVGLNNFTKYSYDFRNLNEDMDRIVARGDLDRKSSHNSYINILAEGGLLLFIPYVLLIIYLLFYLVLNFKRIPDFQKPFFWGIIGISIHLYFITAILNVFMWVLIGLAGSAIRFNNK